MSTRLFQTAILALLILSSCDDTTNDIGISLTENVDKLAVATSTFDASSRSVAVDSVISRSTTGYLGRIKDTETDAYVTGDFMTQFNRLLRDTTVLQQILRRLVGHDETHAL